MKKIHLLIFFALALFAFGCNSYNYVTGNASGNASLSCDCKWKVVKSISTTVIGKVKDTDIAARAKAQLLEENPLKANQALANVTTDIAIRRKWMTLGPYSPYLPLGKKVLCTISADVIEFETK